MNAYDGVMQIVLNGDTCALPEPCTVEQLLADRNLTGRPAAVEINGNVIPRAQHDTYTLTDGDRIEIVTLVGGG